jgi:hypothetical protein
VIVLVTFSERRMQFSSESEILGEENAFKEIKAHQA